MKKLLRALYKAFWRRGTIITTATVRNLKCVYRKCILYDESLLQTRTLNVSKNSKLRILILMANRVQWNQGKGQIHSLTLNLFPGSSSISCLAISFTQPLYCAGIDVSHSQSRLLVWAYNPPGVACVIRVVVTNPVFRRTIQQKRKWENHPKFVNDRVVLSYINASLSFHICEFILGKRCLLSRFVHSLTYWKAMVKKTRVTSVMP